MSGKYKNDKSIIWQIKINSKARNISGYENKSKKDLIKALSEPKSESPKPEIPKLKIPKPWTEIKVDKKKLKKLRQDFDELRHKFDKKEIDRYRKAFYDVKNYENLSVSKIKKVSKSLNKLKKCLKFKKFHGNIDSQLWRHWQLWL